MTRLCCACCVLLTGAGLLVSVPVGAGDEDEKPAYMIYIDPETGKYTTEDPDNPDATDGPAALPGPEHDADKEAWDTPMLLLAGGVVVAMLVGAFYRQQRKPLN